MENNKLIAEFMALPLVPCSIGTSNGIVKEGYKHPKVNVPCTPSGMQYKNSWDWLMPVVEKCFDVALDGDMVDIMHHLQVADREATYNAVVEFIKWYNKTNK